MVGDQPVDDLAVGLQRRKRRLLILAHEPAVTDHIGCKDGGHSALNAIHGHARSRGTSSPILRLKRLIGRDGSAAANVRKGVNKSPSNVLIVMSKIAPTPEAPSKPADFGNAPTEDLGRPHGLLQNPADEPSCTSAICWKPSSTVYLHDGIALGFDRLCAVLCATTSIRG